MKIKLLNKKCKPYRAHKTDSGLDLRVNSEKPVKLKPFKPRVIKTGIAVELEKGYEAQIRPRSGVTKRGILTPLGTIDNGFRGEIGVTMINLTRETKVIEPYERIAQLVVAPVVIPNIEYTDELSNTERGVGGFGSTKRI